MPSLQIPNGNRMKRYCGCNECILHNNPNRVLKRSTKTNKETKNRKDKDDLLLECYFRSKGFYKYGGLWKKKKVT